MKIKDNNSINPLCNEKVDTNEVKSIISLIIS